MIYYSFNVKDKEYKARLTAKTCIDLEKKLGTNPLNVMMSIDEKKMPSLDVLITILHYSLVQYQHGLTLDGTYAVYDDMVDEGKGIADLLNIVIEIFRVSGFIPEATTAEAEAEKNA